MNPERRFRDQNRKFLFFLFETFLQKSGLCSGWQK